MLPINLKGHELCQQTVCPVGYCFYKLKDLWPEAIGIDAGGDELYPNRLVQRRLRYIKAWPSREFMESQDLPNTAIIIELTDEGLNVTGNDKAIEYLNNLPIWFNHE